MHALSLVHTPGNYRNSIKRCVINRYIAKVCSIKILKKHYLLKFFVTKVCLLWVLVMVCHGPMARILKVKCRGSWRLLACYSTLLAIAWGGFLEQLNRAIMRIILHKPAGTEIGARSLIWSVQKHAMWWAKRNKNFTWGGWF